MAVAKQARSSLVFYEQTNATTVVTAGAPGLKAHLISQDIAPEQPLQESEVVDDSRNPTKPYQDAISIGRGFTIQADPISIGWYLKWLLGNPTTTGAGPYTHVFKLTGTAVMKFLTIERMMNDIAHGHQAWGCVLDRVSFGMNRGDILKPRFDIIGLDENKITALTDATPYSPSKICFRAPQISVLEAGGAFGICQTFNLEFSNGFEGVPVLGNSGRFFDIIEGIGRPTANMTILVTDQAIYDKARNATETSLKTTFTATDGVSTLAFDFPEAIYELYGIPVRGRTGPMTADINVRPYFDDGVGATSLIVTLVNTHPSYTAAIP